MFHLPSKYREVIYQTQEEVFHLISKHWLNISTTTRSVSSYIQTLLSPTLEVFHPGVSSDIQTPRSNILNTRRSVSSDIQTPRRNYDIKHEKVCVAAKIYTPRDNRLNTRKSVSSDIQTPRSNFSQTRRSVSFDIQTPKRNRLTHEEVFHLIPDPENCEAIYEIYDWVFDLCYNTRSVDITSQFLN